MGLRDRVRRLERKQKMAPRITAIIDGRTHSVSILDAIELARDAGGATFKDAPHGSGQLLELLNGLKEGAA